MVGLASADLFTEATRGLQDHLREAALAAGRLQQLHDRDLAMRSVCMVPEDSRENSQEISDAFGKQNGACLLSQQQFQGRLPKHPTVGTTPMMQLQPCSGDAAPGDGLGDFKPLVSPSRGPAVSMHHRSGRGHVAYNLRGTWCQLSTEELQACVPRFQPAVQLHPASDIDPGVHLAMLRARRNLHSAEAKKAADATEDGRCMLDPDTPTRLLWSLPAIFFVAYDTLMVPLQAFHAFIGDSFGLWLIELLIAIYWTVDVAVSFRTGYFQGTMLEMRPHQAAKQYMRTWFGLDAVLVLMEWVGQFVGTLENASVVRVTRVLRVVRCARLLRLIKLPNVWKLIEDQVNSNHLHLLFGVLKTILVFLVFVHAITCGWYAIGADSSTGWTTYDVAALQENHFFFWYFAASRWVLAQINGRTDLDERRNAYERLFTCIVAVVFTVVFMSIFLSSITATVLQLSELSAKSSQARRSINEYLQHHRVSASLVTSVKRQTSASTGINMLRDDEERERQVLAQLPEHLQYDLLYEIRAPVLTWHGFFRELDLAFPRVARHICLAAVRPAIAHHAQNVFDQGDPCSRMLFVDKGKLVYSQDDEKARGSQHDAAKAGDGKKLSPRSKLKRGDTGGFAVLPTPEPPCRRSITVADMDASDKEWKVRPGMWLSEGSLWIEWENQGRLVADADSSLMALDAEDLARTLLAYHDAYAMSAVYARRFAEALRAQERPSDLMKVTVAFEAV